LRFKYKEDLHSIIQNVGSEEEAAVREVMLHLASCHTIVIDKNSGEFNAASPDELALVEGARSYGFEFKGKDKRDGSLLV